MEEEKAIVNKEKYDIITSRIVYYMKSKNIARIFKEKCPIFAAGGNEGIIDLFSNSLEHMGYFSGHIAWIKCLCPISKIILASGSGDSTIKMWKIEDRSIMSTLSGHKEGVSALCSVSEGVLVSGSEDKSLIIWSKSPPESSTYSPTHVLTGHNSCIMGIIRVNNREIVSGDSTGDLMMWNINEGLCIRHIPKVSVVFDDIWQMKQHIGGDVVASYSDKVIVCGAANDWGENPIKQFDNVCLGCSIEFLSGNLLLRGGFHGQLEFIDYAQIGCKLPLMGLHSTEIYAIQRIVKNIVVTASADEYLKVIDPISRICYLKFKARWSLEALAYLY